MPRTTKKVKVPVIDENEIAIESLIELIDMFEQDNKNNIKVFYVMLVVAVVCGFGIGLLF